MSVIQVKKALHDFSVKGHGSAIVLKGDWGTGKTFLWETVVREHGAQFRHKRYSYISLFGINSLKDLKRSIFENTVFSAGANSENPVLENLRRLDSTNGSMLGWANRGVRKLFGSAAEAKVPHLGSISGIIDSVQYSLTSKTLICIDDFERRGSSLSSRDVLGLVSNLIEKKGCSVLLVLNEGSLKIDDEFFTFSEKVFDYEVRYAPTLDEAAGVVFSGFDEYEEKIVENVKKLKINNIRLLRKVKYFASLIKPFVENRPAEILEKSTKLIPLAIYAKYSGGDKVVDIEDLEIFRGGFSLLPPDKRELTAEQKAIEDKELIKQSFLQLYGYDVADDFTVELIKLIKNGYADSASLLPLIDSIVSTVEVSKRRKLISDAWHVFHHDISVPDMELLDLFENAVKQSGDAASPHEVEGVLEIFTAAGQESRGKAVVDEYFKILGLKRSINHRREMYKQPQNHYVIEKLEEYFDDGNKVWTLDELVDNFHGRAITGEVLELLSVFTVGQFYLYFKKLSPLKFVSYTNSLLALGTRTGLLMPINYYEIVFLKVFEALKLVHDESPLMALRMNKFMEFQQIYDHKITLAQGTGDAS